MHTEKAKEYRLTGVVASLLIITLVVSTIGAASFSYAAGEYTFVRKWGSQGNGDGLFEEPTGIAIDSSNSVYVSDMDFEKCCSRLTLSDELSIQNSLVELGYIY